MSSSNTNEDTSASKEILVAPTTSDNVSKLASQNSSTLGASFPVITLADGQKVPTGTIGAFLFNVRRYDALVAEKADDGSKAEKDQELDRLAETMRLAIPVLNSAGMFSLFTPEEWASGDRSPGRKLVGEEAGRRGL